MGNCLKSNRVMAQDDHPYSPPTEAPKKVEDKPAGGSSALAKPRTGAPAGKKVVRFKLEEEGESSGGIGDGGGDGGAETEGKVLRIKVVMSQKELKQILKDRENNSCSLEELIAELKVKGRTTVSDARTDELEDENRSSWRPALEFIPEDLH